MDVTAIILIALGILVVLGFLKQFGILGGRGVLFAIAAVALGVGWSLFQERRLKRRDREFKQREAQLREQEKKLEKWQREYQLSRDEVYEARAALQRERAKYAKSIADIEAEKEADIRAARARINNSTISEILKNY